MTHLKRQRRDVLAVIVPTLNSETHLPTLLRRLNGVRLVISDGGSADGTLDLAVAHGAVIASGCRSRGAQLARGAELAKAADDVTAYLFLHADCELDENWRSVSNAALQKTDTAWYFRYRPDTSGRGVLWLQFIVWLRGWAWRLPYGDQGLLISRDMYDAIGGYDPSYPLFEDVEIIDRIKATFGRQGLKKLPLALSTDISDHLREGVWKRGWRNYRLLKAYRRGEPIDALLRRYG
jgi:glycosyltransferase involved in cell wall biosynthesis